MKTKEIKTKRCSKCGRELPVDNFYKDNRTTDGLYCDCKECHGKIAKKYIEANKDIVNQKKRKFKSKFKGRYVYIIQNKNNEIVYVGQTSNYYNRLMRHLSRSVDSTKELFDSDEWGSIKYLDVSGLVENDMELKVLENMLIELYEPKLNKVKNIIRDINNDRIFTLIATLHNMNNDWKVFRVNK